MCCIYDYSVNAGFDECLRTLHGVSCYAYSGGNTQTAFVVLACHWLVFCLCYVFISDKSYKLVVLVHYRQLLYLVLLQDFCGGYEVCLLVCGYKILLCHDIVNSLVHAPFETQVPVCDDTNKMILIVNDGNSSYMVFRHHVEGISYRTSFLDGNRIVNHAVLSTLDDSHLASLFVDGHVLVNDTDTSLTCHSDSH